MSKPNPMRPPTIRPFRTVAGIFDVHVPEHDPRAVEAFLAWAKHEQPDEIVIGGDFLELGSVSSHGGDPDPPHLVDELRPARELLRKIKSTCPDAKLVYLEGNHETRLTRWINDKAPGLAGALTLPVALGLEEMGIQWVPYGKTHKAGKLHFVHGFWCNDLHAKKHLLEYGSSVTYGHTHRPQIFTKGLVDGTVHGAFGMPCMRLLDAPYLNHKPSGWMQGFGIYYVMPSGHFTPHMVLINRGSFVYGGRQYGKIQKAAA